MKHFKGFSTFRVIMLYFCMQLQVQKHILILSMKPVVFLKFLLMWLKFTPMWPFCSVTSILFIIVCAVANKVWENNDWDCRHWGLNRIFFFFNINIILIILGKFCMGTKERKKHLDAFALCKRHTFGSFWGTSNTSWLKAPISGASFTFWLFGHGFF